MPALASCAPILPGKEETDREGFEEILGPRREDYDASRRRAGITRDMTEGGPAPELLLEATF
jgi:hypothetical protein